jgi:outer membrane immunogenic protein
MKTKALTLAAMIVAGVAAQPAFAQEVFPELASDGTSFRGIRIEGNAGGERFMSEGNHNDKFGYGGTIGFDGTLGERIVIGAEASYWKPGKGNENCTDLSNSNSICHKAFQEIGVAFRAGYLVTPSVLIFGKGGFVNREQRTRIGGPTGQQLSYDHYKSDGYQLGGGAELTLTQGRAPVYVNAQYVYSNYHGHSSAQRVMGGVGIRFK